MAMIHVRRKTRNKYISFIYTPATTNVAAGFFFIRSKEVNNIDKNIFDRR